MPTSNRRIEGALFGIFLNQGEVCSAGSRILVQRPMYRRFLDAMVAKAETIRLGPGSDRATKMGPLVSQAQLDRILAYQEIGKREAKLATGGSRATDGALAGGFFVQPTIFYDVDNSARIAREENLRPGCLRHPVRRRVGQRPPGQRHLVRPRGGRLDP